MAIVLYHLLKNKFFCCVKSICVYHLPNAFINNLEGDFLQKWRVLIALEDYLYLLNTEMLFKKVLESKERGVHVYRYTPFHSIYF